MKLAPTIELFANYKLDGRTTFQGLPISIENDRGSTRSGVDSDGKPWSVTMTYPYGYIRRTEGVDGDHVDCFIGPNKEAPNVYVIHTVDPKTGKYDEDKVCLGFSNAQDAKQAFLENYSSPKFFGSLETLPFAEFKKKVLDTKDHPGKITAGGQGSGCRGPNCGRKSGRSGKSSQINKKMGSINRNVTRIRSIKKSSLGIAQQKVDELKKSFAQMPAPKPLSRVQQMTSDTWISKDGTRTHVSRMQDRHLISVLRQLHEQLALAKGEASRTGQHYRYESRVGQDGPTIARAIPPYNRLVAEAKKRGLHW